MTANWVPTVLPSTSYTLTEVSPLARPILDKDQARAWYAFLPEAITAVNANSTGRLRVVRGLTEVTKILRKCPLKAGNAALSHDIGAGVVLLAGDVHPFDGLAHIPLYCEAVGWPYVFVSSKDDLGSAARCRGPASAVIVALRTPTNASRAEELTETERALSYLLENVPKLGFE